MKLTNEIIKGMGYKRINNSMFRNGNITLQNGFVHYGETVLEKMFNTKKAYKVCVNGKFTEMVTISEQLIDIEQSVGNF